MIGNKIKERRLALKLSQNQLEIMTGIKKNTISNYENNISSPSEDNLVLLMKALECDANYLFSDFVKSESITPHEKSIIQKYRIIDAHGKKMVDYILNEEYNRCVCVEDTKPQIAQLVARSSSEPPASVKEITDDEYDNFKNATDKSKDY